MSLSAALARYGWKFVLGGTVIVVVSYLSETDRPGLAGLAILFPTITLTSYALIGHTQGLAQVRATVPTSLAAIPGYLVLLPTIYLASRHLGLAGTLLVGFAAWLAVTLPLLAYAS